MILHHYPMSPFSEKIRVMCGCLDIEWQSVMTTESPPRPHLDSLVGGYRRIPVAQWGADIVCDTRRISEELARRHDRPLLAPSNLSRADRDYCRYLEGDVFWAAVVAVPARRLLLKLFTELSFTHALRFVRDRAGVARNARTPPVARRRAASLFAEHLVGLEQRLAEDHPFLTGDQPGYLDFAAYHTLWFQHVVGAIPLPEKLPHVIGWYRRMALFGHGREHAASPETALAAATRSSPEEGIGLQVEGAIPAGSMVMVRPLDYALDGTSGVLARRDAVAIAIDRETRQLGAVRVHFPAEGFDIEAA
jgi:glutathione S-transferase